uniref:Centrosomal protein of 192 kDalike [Takifugu rubripes] n=1 Tax=Lepeophtheirus salmonis TaxID=72036 RepID=A0A0K2V3J6_LEPSM
MNSNNQSPTTNKRRNPLSSIENICSLNSPRPSDIKALIRNGNISALNFSSIIKKTSPVDIIEAILHSPPKSGDKSSFRVHTPELPSFLHFSEDEEASPGTAKVPSPQLKGDTLKSIRIYPKKLNFGILSNGCWDTRTFTLTNMHEFDVMVKIEAYGPLSIFLQKEERYSSEALNLILSPCNQYTIHIKFQSSEAQEEKKKVDSEIVIVANGIVVERVSVTAVIGYAKLNIPKRDNLEIFPSIRKEETLFVKAIGNVPLTLGVLGTESSLKSGTLELSEKHLVLNSDCAAYSLKAYFESNDQFSDMNEKGNILLQTLPNGPVHKIPFLIHHEGLKDFPIEADASSLTWSNDSTTKTLSLKNSTNLDIPLKLMFDATNDESAPPCFFILEGGEHLTQKNILFPSNSILTFRLFYRRNTASSSSSSHKSRLLIKLINTPFKAAIFLSSEEHSLPSILLLHPPSILLIVPRQCQKSFTLSNTSNWLLNWRALWTTSSQHFQISQLSGILKPRESKELMITFQGSSFPDFGRTLSMTQEIEFECRTLNSDFSKSSSRMLCVLRYEERNESSECGREQGHMKRISLEDPHIYFPKTIVGTESVSKVTVRNKTFNDEELRIYTPARGHESFSFHVPYERVSIKSRSYLRFPVQFKPQSVGMHTSHIFIRNSNINLTACVCGEAIEEEMGTMQIN